MKKLFILAFLLLVGGGVAQAQGQFVSGAITAADSGTECATTNGFVSIGTGGGSSASVAFSVSGTFSATLQFVTTVDGTNYVTVNAYPPNSTTAVTSTTGSGTWTVSIPAQASFCVRASAYTSGSATVNMRNSTAVSASTLGGGGGGSGGSAFPVTVTGGVSGAVPCFTSTTTEAAGTLLALDAMVYGGGAGACPATDSGITTNTSGQLSAVNFVSTVSTGTAPLTVTSTTNVPNLNASSVSGNTVSAPTQYGIAYGSTATNYATTAALTANALIKAGSSAAPSASSVTDNGTTVSSAELMTLSAGNALSNSTFLMSGAPITGGSGTTTFPLFYMNDGAAPTTFATAGTEIGINAPSGFGGNFLDFHLNGGATLFEVDNTGAMHGGVASGGTVYGNILDSAATYKIGGTYGSPGHTLISATAPTIASGFGTGPSIPNNDGTAVFTVNVGTGGTATSGVITMPAATTGWGCTVAPNGAPQAAAEMFSAPTSTTSITITNYTTSTGVALAWPASAVLQVTCTGY